MDIRVLKYFVTIVKSGSFNKASANLFITQPTLSRQIQALEEDLHIQLLDRSQKGIKLTTKGELFYERALEILDQIDKLSLEMTQNKELQGVINIGAGESCHMTFIGRAIKEFSLKHPFVKFNIITETKDVVENKILNNVYDLALVIGDVNEKEFLSYNLSVPNTWGLITSSEGPLKDIDTIDISKLRGLPLIVSAALFKNRLLDGYLNYPLEKLRIACTYTLINNAISLVYEKVGHIVAFDKIIDPLPSTLKFIKFTPEITITSAIIWKKNKKQPEHVKIFLDTLQQVLIKEKS